MMTTSKTTKRRYWLALSALFAVTVSVVAMTDPPWSVAMVAALVLLAVLQGIHYKQIGRHIQGNFATANLGVGILGAAFGGAAVLIHGSPVAPWAGPVLGLVTFVGMNLFLRRFGRFHHSPSNQRT